MDTPELDTIEPEVQPDCEKQAARLEEEVWVLQAQNGDESAFGRLMERFDQRLRYYLGRFTSDPEQALDLAQEVWVAVFRGLRKLRHPALFRAWLYRIAHARVVSQIRRNVREEQVLESFSSEQEHAFSGEEPGASDPELIHRALTGLSPEHREVLVLRFLEDLSLEEIAHALECNLGTIKSRLHYAKQALKHQLQSL